MTSSAAPASSAPRDSAPVTALVRVRGPGDLAAAVPALIGFHPRESLVLIGTGGASGRRVVLTLRVDLPPPHQVEALCAHAAESLLAGSPDGAALLVLTAGEPGAGGPPGAAVVAAATAALDARGVPVHTATWAAATVGGSRWACYGDCGCSGVLPPTGTTAAAAAAVAAGQVVYADRAELAALVDPVGRAVLERRDALLTRRLDAVAAASDPGGRGPDDVAAGAVLDAALADAAAGRLTLDDERVVALACALAAPAVRDAALAACAGPRAAAAEQLWAALVRETPDPEAAEPAALLALSALLRGSGALANVALDRAQAAWPGHRLTGTLRAAVDMGLSPRRIRDCLEATAAANPAAANPAAAGAGAASARRRPPQRRGRRR